MQAKFRIAGKEIFVQESLVDKVVSALDPIRGRRRFQARCQMAIAGGYNGGKRKSRTLSGWNTTSNDADADLLPDLSALREYSRDLTRNTPIAAGAINTAVTNIAGSGLRLNAMIDRDYLGLSDDEADAWQSQAEREFNFWAEKARYCDAASTTNFYEHHDLALRSTFENGDVFYLLPMINRMDAPYKVKLQVVEADRVCNKDSVRDTNTLAGGIELDQHGSPKNYHFAKHHPGNLSRKSREWDVISAFGAKSGRRNVIHLFEQKRPGQRRGIPYLAPVIESLKQVGRYTDAELMAAVVSGMFTVFIKSEDGDTELGNENGAKSDNDESMELGNGKILSLNNDESIETANPGRPNTAFDPFVTAILRQVGASLEIPYELLIKHFTSSYSASRAALMEAWKMFKKRRKWLADNFCAPVYEAVITEAVITGRIAAPGFLDDPRIRAAYLGAEWIGPGKGQIQEKQEVEAADKRVKAGFSTIAKESAEMNGGDWNRNHRQQVRETNARVEGGLIEAIVQPQQQPLPDKPDKK